MHQLKLAHFLQQVTVAAPQLKHLYTSGMGAIFSLECRFECSDFTIVYTNKKH
jgi:hypothetical protein